METHQRFDVERRGQVIEPGPISRWLRPVIAGVRARIPDPWINDYIYGYLSHQARNRFRGSWSYLLPTTVSLETRTICNGRCAFCAASVPNRTREDKSMPWEVFARIVDELAGVNYSGRLAFFVNNEPLLDKNLEEKIAHARRRLPCAFLQVSTNGILLTQERANALFDAGLDDLTVNDYADNRPVRGDLARVLSVISPERRRMLVIYLRDAEEKLFNRAGSAPNAPATRQPMRAFCQMPFTQINIVWDGTVSLCCQDLMVQVPIGNAFNEGLWAVWFSERYREIRRRLLDKDRNATDLCRICDFCGFKTLTGPLRPLNRLFRVLK